MRRSNKYNKCNFISTFLVQLPIENETKTVNPLFNNLNQKHKTHPLFTHSIAPTTLHHRQHYTVLHYPTYPSPIFSHSIPNTPTPPLYMTKFHKYINIMENSAG